MYWLYQQEAKAPEQVSPPLVDPPLPPEEPAFHPGLVQALAISFFAATGAADFNWFTQPETPPHAEQPAIYQLVAEPIEPPAVAVPDFGWFSVPAVPEQPEDPWVFQELARNYDPIPPPPVPDIVPISIPIPDHVEQPIFLYHVEPILPRPEPKRDFSRGTYHTI